jgi:DNA-binding FadR family transcriptional regulator
MATAGVDTADAGVPPVDEPTGKLATQVARRIEADVLRRGWPVGESLGSEPQLRERFGVSRAVLREAVRLLEHHQVARMRRGPGGGLFVTAPDAAPATGAVVIYLEYVGTGVDDLMHARALVEPLAAQLAAERISEEGIERLRAGLDADGAGTRGRLDVLLAGLSGNPVLELFVEVLTRLTDRYETGHEQPAGAGAPTGADELRSRTAIVDAVVAGEGGRAAALMAQHLDGEAARLHGQHPADPGPRPTANAQTKLAEVIAARIREDIVARGWPVDAVLGSESELLARYRISRAVLREAVRLLEYHAVARMRRGPGGGLLVTRPDPQASIDTIALHLEYRRVAGDDLRVVRDAIELGALDRVLAGTDPDGLDGAAADRLRASAAHVTEGLPGDPVKADLFHTELAELAGNPVLVLFLRIITELFRAHTSAQAEPLPYAETAGEVRRVHERILSAVLDGDAGLARHRMRRHLEALQQWWH